MKYLSIMILGIFLNFTALPSIAQLMDWDLPTMSQNISEEEVKTKRMSEEQLHNEPFQVNLHQWDHFKQKKAFALYNDNKASDPLLIIFSPPPEI